MDWDDFRELPIEVRSKIISLSVFLPVYKAILKKYNENFPNKPIDDEEFRFLTGEIFHFYFLPSEIEKDSSGPDEGSDQFLFRISLLTERLRRPIHAGYSFALTNKAENTGELLLILMIKHRDLVFGFKEKVNGAEVKGLFRRVIERQPRMDVALRPLCLPKYENQISKMSVDEFVEFAQKHQEYSYLDSSKATFTRNKFDSWMKKWTRIYKEYVK